MLAWVTLALAPIAVASIFQGLDSAKRDFEDVRERLVQSARAASISGENVFASSEQVARALGNLPDVLNATSSCNGTLSAARTGLNFVVNIARIDANGRTICAALPRTIGYNSVKLKVWQQARSSSEFRISEQIYGTIVRKPLIVGMLPMHDTHRRFIGAIAVVLDPSGLEKIARSQRLPAKSVVAIFDRDGTIIASNRRDIAAPIFGRASTASLETATLYNADDRGGNTWTFTISPLLGRNIFVGLAMRESRLFGAIYVHVGTDFLMPILMIALAWAAIWAATERQVSRWIDYLRRVAVAYRSGHYALRPYLENAPLEFGILGDALSTMAQSIQDRDRRLRDALAQKSVLIREIHHRVKNNLQIVMSLLSLQSSQLKDSASQEALKQARLRINALALVHRTLHTIEDQTIVDLKPLLEQISRQTQEGLGGDRASLRVATDIASIRVSGDVAIPLALFTVEALTNIFKHAFPDPTASGRVDLTLVCTQGGSLKLAIRDDGVGYNLSNADMGVGAKLMQTFGEQVHGKTTIISRPDGGTTVELIFPAPVEMEDMATGT